MRRVRVFCSQKEYPTAFLLASTAETIMKIIVRLCDMVLVIKFRRASAGEQGHPLGVLVRENLLKFPLAWARWSSCGCSIKFYDRRHMSSSCVVEDIQLNPVVVYDALFERCHESCTLIWRNVLSNLHERTLCIHLDTE